MNNINCPSCDKLIAVYKDHCVMNLYCLKCKYKYKFVYGVLIDLIPQKNKCFIKIKVTENNIFEYIYEGSINQSKFNILENVTFLAVMDDYDIIKVPIYLNDIKSNNIEKLKNINDTLIINRTLNSIQNYLIFAIMMFLNLIVQFILIVYTGVLLINKIGILSNGFVSTMILIIIYIIYFLIGTKYLYKLIIKNNYYLKIDKALEFRINQEYNILNQIQYLDAKVLKYKNELIKCKGKIEKIIQYINKLKSVDSELYINRINTLKKGAALLVKQGKYDSIIIEKSNKLKEIYEVEFYSSKFEENFEFENIDDLVIKLDDIVKLENDYEKIKMEIEAYEEISKL